MANTKNIISNILRIGLAVSLIAYLIYSGAIDWKFLSGLFVSWHFTAVALLGFFLLHFIIAYRLKILIDAHGLRLDFFPAVRLTFIGLFFNTYLPGAQGGDLVKIYYASKGNPGKRAEIITIMIFDRIIGMFSLFVTPLLLAPFFYSDISGNAALQGLLLITGGVSLGVVVCVVIGLKMDVEQGRLFVWLYTTLPKGDLLKRILVTIHSYRHNKKQVLLAVMLSVSMQTLVIGSMLFIAAAILPGGADARMAILIPMGFLATALPITPGGIGVGEAALDGLFNLFGLHGGAELLLGWRLLMVLLGMIGLYYYIRADTRFIHHDVDAR